ncbi:hypothetical protein [Nitrosospira multiformis]|uniref:hypothetical protein n=1 Tax=Nitrosospira multiformis TaxID=1231 RepID=UPI00116080F9|nr:hypothetical protein [Nitrosospira multiformis]
MQIVHRALSVLMLPRLSKQFSPDPASLRAFAPLYVIAKTREEKSGENGGDYWNGNMMGKT